MKPILKFETMRINMSDLGKESSVPDVLGGSILQNDVEFHLGEEDEIYEGYGKKKNSYPYRQYNCYTRTLKEQELTTAVLENDHMRAVFLPTLGGRLWSLIDKETDVNLLYTNDVIRFSNLAVRNAWFSGGVEWNIGVIGHTPLTNECLHTARLSDAEGNPVLRMYEYERIRGLEYQMDFWLGSEDKFLNCRMRVVNPGREVVPMYWWSNMAVPEYEHGRIVVPAKEAYTYRQGGIYKTAIPVIDDTDISYYQNISEQVDYFFDIPKESRKYIANLGADGYGLLHMSTQRLKSRKLFSWGNNDGSDRWQEFLTEDAGRYVEIQAGLSKTQYGCIPMAPRTAWEWVEQYGPVKVTKEAAGLPYEELLAVVNGHVEKEWSERQPERVLQESKHTAKTAGDLVLRGSGYGALKQACILAGSQAVAAPMNEQLDYGTCQEKQQIWEEFLNTGVLREPEIEDVPEDFMCEHIFFELLKRAPKHWYVHYQLGIMYLWKESYEEAERELQQSLLLKDNPWACHGLACLCCIQEAFAEAAVYISRGLAYRTFDLSYVKESFRILLLSEAYDRLLEAYETLPEVLRQESRIRFGYIKANYCLGKVREAYQLLNQAYLLCDIREGEDSLSELWSKMHRELFQEEGVVPHALNFQSFTEAADGLPI